MPNTVLCAGTTTVYRTDKNLCSRRVHNHTRTGDEIGLVMCCNLYSRNNAVEKYTQRSDQEEMNERTSRCSSLVLCIGMY